ncbi:MAG TPA: aminoglycoside phosphotransferase family protein [Devosia sp.]|nr:aminoglycoside phosphotransferase family protein [Devosia sp.]
MSAPGWPELLPPLLRQAGIVAGGPLEIVPLTGGVSSDIVRIGLSDGRSYCAKRALPRLKVASDWQAPLERNRYEAAWLRHAGRIVPGIAPSVLAEDDAHGVVLLDYLPPADYRLWKAELLAGRADPATPRAVADALGRIHAATLNDPAVAAAFPTDALFDALRLDPYLRTLAARQPALAGPILACLEVTAATKLALIHGDVSPKNILVSARDGHPVLLDAECAWYGDPAFDAAFCLNHLLLKAVHLPAIRAALLEQAAAFFATWISHFPAGLRSDTGRRAAVLLPCLMLARVDGKSPVEYLDAAEQQLVRDIAMPLIADPPDALGRVLAGLHAHLPEGEVS